VAKAAEELDRAKRAMIEEVNKEYEERKRKLIEE
jgi:hypothetical protein